MSKVERYLKSEQTFLARGLRRLSPSSGSEYRNSTTKNILDIAVATPATVFISPAAVIGLAASAIEREGNPVSIQKRRGQNWGELPVVKIYTMRKDAEKEESKYLSAIQAFGDKADPRITRAGRPIRSLDIDDSLQLAQVVIGQLSLIGVRAVADYAVDAIRESHPEGFEGWKQAYMDGKPSVLSLNSAFSSNRKDESRRYRYDMIYARKASLGLDLLILYKHAENAFRFLGRTVNDLRVRFSSLTPPV